MKKTISLVLTAALAVSLLSGCGTKTTPATTTPPATTPATTPKSDRSHVVL